MNANKLKAKTIENGINVDTLSKIVGIDRGTFYRKLRENRFSVEEAGKISAELNLSAEEIIDIFFENYVA
jgi:hypothetical protein